MRLRVVVVVSSAMPLMVPGFDCTEIEENRDDGQLFATLLI